MPAERFKFVNFNAQEVNTRLFKETQKHWVDDLLMKQSQAKYFTEVLSLNQWSESSKIIAIGDKGNILSFLADEGVSCYLLPYSVMESIAVLGIAKGFPNIL